MFRESLRFRVETVFPFTFPPPIRDLPAIRVTLGVASTGDWCMVVVDAGHGMFNRSSPRCRVIAAAGGVTQTG
jgi:hypothetical protein